MPDILHTMTIILPNSALPRVVLMIIKKRWSLAAKPAGECGNQCLFLNTAYAGNKNISLIRNPDIPQSVTRDSDHQPDYNDILSQRIQSSQRALGLEVNLAEETPVDVTSSMSMGWNFPLYEQVTTGPVAALHYDGTTTSMYNEFGDSTTTLADPLWHASVSTLGWRVDSRLGDLRPRAQISYNQQFGENIWKAQSGLSRMTATNQNGNWLDVTVGADMLLNQNIAAYAALSQAENTTNNSDYLYTMGLVPDFNVIDTIETIG